MVVNNLDKWLFLGNFHSSIRTGSKISLSSPRAFCASCCKDDGMYVIGPKETNSQELFIVTDFYDTTEKGKWELKQQ